MTTEPGFIESLNHYSNLLLVIITAIYAWLTWKSLNALQRSNLLEREAKHLDDIKMSVSTPILLRISEILEIINGERNIVIVRDARLDAPEGITPERAYQICRVSMNPNYSYGLYQDARKHHFQDQLNKFESFTKIFETLLIDIAEFGRACCDEMYKVVGLPSAGINDRRGTFIDYESFFQVCSRYLLFGLPPEFSVDIEGKDFSTISSQYNQNVIARDLSSNMSWIVPKLTDLVETRWRESGFRERISRTREDAESVRTAIQDIQFTLALSGKCKYVGSADM
jgi:hypothetical protein